MVLKYSRIALEFYRTALKNYSETALDMFLNVYGTSCCITLYETVFRSTIVLVKVLKIYSRQYLELEKF